MTTRTLIQRLVLLLFVGAGLCCAPDSSSEMKAPPELKEIVLPGLEGGEGSGGENSGTPGTYMGEGGGGSSYGIQAHCREQDNTMAAGTAYETQNGWFTMPETLGGGLVDISGDIVSTDVVEFDRWNGELDDEADLTTGIFADLDKDGISEVIISSEGSCYTATCPIPFRYDMETGTLVHAPELEEFLPDLKQGVITGIMDLTGDGLEDALMTFSSTLLKVQNPTGNFAKDVKIEVPEGYPYTDFRDVGALALVDIDQNGFVDVIEGDSTCQAGSVSYQVALQMAPGEFVAGGPGMLGEGPPARADGILATPLGPSGEFMIQLLGEACDKTDPHTGFVRRTGWDDDGFPIFEIFEPFDLDAHFKAFSSVSYGPYSLIHPMGGTVGDLDMDGLWDTISTYSPPSSNPGSVQSAVFGVFGAADSWPLIDWSYGADAGPPAGEQYLYQIPWANALLDFNGDGLADLITTHGPDWEGLHVESRWAGLQDVTLHLARGPQCFEDATALSGINQPGNWRSLAVGDLEGDGDPDIIVGGYGEVPRVYRNDIKTSNNLLAIRLKGHTSNAPGIGAVIRVEAQQAVKGQPQYMGHIGSPLTVSEPYVFAGLGPATKADKVIVEWPSGYTQVVENLEAGQVHWIEEPPIMEVVPEDRTVSVGQDVTITVTPRTETGELNLDAKVKGKVFAGDGSIVNTVLLEDGYAVRIAGPDVPGSVVVEISIDDEPLGVRPRFFWE